MRRAATISRTNLS